MDERDTRLSQVYRAAPHPEPPAALDAAILDAAHVAVARRHRRRSAWLAWGIPLSGTAVLVLGLSLLLRMQQEAPRALSPSLPAALPPTLSDQAPPNPAPALAAPEGRQLTPSPAPPKAARTATPSQDRSRDAAAHRSERQWVAPAPEFLPSLPAQPAPSSTAASAAAPVPLRDGPATAASGPVARSDAPSPDAARPRSAAPASPAAEALEPLPRPAPAAVQTLGKAAPLPDSPEDYLGRLRQLQRDARLAEARQLLAEFRQRHPDYPLPADLRALEGKGPLHE